MSSSWRTEKIVQFIDAIRLRPCLWDITKLDYKNRNLKKDEWNAIGFEFEISSEEAQKKFKNLRTYFKNEIKKEEKKQKSGTGAPQESSWFAFKSMSFIRTIDEADPRKDNESQLEMNENCDDETSPSTSRQQLQPAHLLSPSVCKKMKRTDEDKQYETACEVMELEKNKMSRKTLAFGDHVNEKLLTYSKFVRNQVEHKISTILYEADMGPYGRPSYHGNSSLLNYSPSPAVNHSSIPSPQAMRNHGIRLSCQDNNKIDDDNVVDNTRSSSPISRPPSPSPPGMTGPYLLKKETHCTSILDELLKDDTFTDVTLTAEGQHLKAHRIILCLSSKYFKDVLSKESTAKNVIFFRDIKFEELKNIITFIYTGEVTVDASDLESFMKTAELLEVTSLCEGHKNFPKGFPLCQNSEPHGIFKPSPNPAKRTISNSSYSPPTKSRKIISAAETPLPIKSSRRKRSQPATLGTFVTIKSEPDVTESEYFSENDSKEDKVETSNEFVDVGHLSDDEELQPKTPFKDGSRSDNEKDLNSVPLNDSPPVSGRCPFCPPSRQLFADATMLTHLQVSHPEETAYPCDVCYTVFTKKLSFLDHHKDCKR